ncbi:hypothetical protein RCL1_005322 [Eukaryota sp. TZLM3-RCL]
MIPNLTVVLKRLPETTNERALFKLLEPFGHVTSLKLPQNEEGSKGVAFVEFSSEDTVSKVLTSPLYIDHKPVISEPYTQRERSNKSRQMDWTCPSCSNVNFSTRVVCFNCGNSISEESKSLDHMSSYFTDTLMIRPCPPHTTHADIHTFIRSKSNVSPRSVVFSRNRGDVFVTFSHPFEALKCLRKLQLLSPKSVSEGTISPSENKSLLLVNNTQVAICFAREPSSGTGKCKWDEAPAELYHNITCCSEEKEDTKVEETKEILEDDDDDEDSVAWIMDTYRDLAAEAHNSGQKSGLSKTLVDEIPQHFYHDNYSNLYYLPGTYYVFDPSNQKYFQYSETSEDFFPSEPPGIEDVEKSIKFTGLPVPSIEPCLSISSSNFSIPVAWSGFPVLAEPAVEHVNREYIDRAKERRKLYGVYSGHSRIEKASEDKPITIANKGRKLLEALGFSRNTSVPPPLKIKRTI